MKKLIVLIAVGVFYLNAMAQEYASASAAPSPKNKYCAQMKNNKLAVVNEGKEVNKDITLDNGTKITADATVVKKDGTKVALTEGECVDNNGNIMLKNEMKKDKTKRMSKPLNPINIK